MNKALLKKISGAIFIFLWMAMSHPFYLGVTDLKYNQKEQALQGSVKLFTNDLEDALSKINKKTVDLINVKDTLAVQKLLELYLKSHLSLKVNGKIKTLHLAGFEKEEDAIWMYVEFKNCENPVKVELQNTLLYDFLKNQANIVHIDVNGQQKSFKNTNPDKDFVFDF